MLPLLEGRVGQAWEPFKKTMLFLPPHHEASLTSPMTLHFHLLFSTLSLLYMTLVT
jgi:hypothetical protein